LSWYEDSKYDVAFIINAMSDDEDDPDWRPTSAEIKNYISHAPDYRSPLLHQILTEIDKIPDPNPT
ncbi:hypothetical protein SERLA73DRAFT_16144, partial [Serpula lacrymans var. lacrymans S7.3]